MKPYARFSNESFSNTSAKTPLTLTRRQLMQMLGIAGAGAAGTGLLAACSGGSGSEAASTTTAKPQQPAAGKARTSDALKTAGRILVMVELQGGNDGFATLVPYTDSRFRKMRERIWVDPKDLAIVDEKYAIAKGLAPIKDRLAFVEGVGVSKPDGSHFAMSDRWWHGDPDGRGDLQTGFLGRCCDALKGDEPITGLSLGGGSSPAMVTARAITASLPQLDMVRELAKDEPSEQRLRAAMDAMANAKSQQKKSASNGDSSLERERLTTIARSNLGSGLELLGTLNKLGERPKSYPENNSLADSLALSSQLLNLDVGVRVIHVPWGSFDTHTGEVGTHSDQMRQVGEALDAFHKDLERLGLSDRVLVATTSEFGRRPESNGSGTDHGAASTMLLSGAVKPGRHGIAPSFSRLDSDGNVKSTVSMSDYYATLATWLGVPPEEVVAKSATPISGLLSV